MKSRCVLAPISAFCLVSFVGCGASIPTYPVSGKVTQAGQPVAGAAVTFTPTSGDFQAAVGITDASGKYTLMTKTNTGAMLGTYKVAIAKYEGEQADSVSTSEPAADPYDITNEYPDNYDEMAESNKAAKKMSQNVLPKRYADANSSGLSAEVVDGDNMIDFDLEKK